MDTCTEKGFVDIDVSQSGDPALVEERRFDGRCTPLEALREDFGSEHRIKRFRTQETVVIVVTGRFNMQNPTELALVREAQVVVIIELEGEMLEAEWSGGAGNNLQHAGHPQVHRYERFVVQHQEQVLGAAGNVHDRAADDACVG